MIVLHFVQDSQLVEQFHGFMQFTLTERSASGISQCILQALEQYKVKDKLISQTYDGGAVFRGVQHGVQKLVRDVYPCTYFIHCYVHQLNLTMQQLCSTITAIRILLPIYLHLLHLATEEIYLIQCVIDVYFKPVKQGGIFCQG